MWSKYVQGLLPEGSCSSWKDRMSSGLRFEGKLWLNSSKEEMARRLREGRSNRGVGIHLGRHKDLIDQSQETVRLVFDDGTEWKARVKKRSWDNCPHLISVSIGAWARRNGLWERKLNQRSVSVILEKAGHNTLRVSRV